MIFSEIVDWVIKFYKKYISGTDNVIDTDMDKDEVETISLLLER
jgi:hypothetical protein